MSKSFKHEANVIYNNSEFVIISAPSRIHHHGEIPINALPVNIVANCSTLNRVQVVAAGVTISNGSSFPLFKGLFSVSLSFVGVLVTSQVNHIKMRHCAVTLRLINISNPVFRYHRAFAKHVNP